MKKFTGFCLSILLMLLLLLAPCGFSPVAAEEKSLDLNNWEEVLARAKGAHVSFYGWGGSDLTNSWIDEKLAPYALEHYGIIVDRVPMDIDLILNKLAGEKTAEASESPIDLIWINGENFATAKENDLLYGPFLEYLPNYKAYINAEDPEIRLDFGVEIEGFEAPYSKAQLVFMFDSERLHGDYEPEVWLDEEPSTGAEKTEEAADDTEGKEEATANDVEETGATEGESKAPDFQYTYNIPFESAKGLLRFCQSHPGEFTYEALPGFTGSAFVRNIIHEVLSEEDYAQLAALDKGASKEDVQKLIQPALDFLLELKPYLWEKGESYPANGAQMDTMFIDGQILVQMSYDPYRVSAMIKQELYPDSVRSFVFDKGTVGNTNYIAIGANTKNLAAALCLADAILSPEMQASKMDPAVWGTLPVMDFSKLSDDEAELFSDIDLTEAGLPADFVVAKRVTELPAHLIPLIEELWLDQIPGK